MISKEDFFKFILEYQTFEQAIDRIDAAISGSIYGCGLWESDWYSAVGKMFDLFVNTHFTELGADWVFYYMFEDIEDKLVTIKQEKDIFNENSGRGSKPHIRDYSEFPPVEGSRCICAV